MGYTYTYGPVVEPLTVDEAKIHLRVDFDDDDAYIESLISAVRWKLERRFRRAILSQTLILGLDYFGMPAQSRDFGVATSPIIELRPPVTSVTSVKYFDTSGTLQTVDPADYTLDVSSEPNHLWPSTGNSWPSTEVRPGAVQITHVSGATDPALVPEDIKMALKLAIGSLYENREEVVIGTRLVALPLPEGVNKLMADYRFPLVR